jgi:hypothetical protein
MEERTAQHLNIMLNTVRHIATFAAVCLVASSALAAPFKSVQGYQITPPQGFSKTASIMGTDVVFAKPSGENLNVVVRVVPRNVPLAQGLSEMKRGMSMVLSGYRSTEQGKTQLGGQPAVFLGGNFRMGTPPKAMRNRQVVALRNGRAYIFTFTSPVATYARHKPTVDKSLASVRWTK